jgi:hypothetical protein
MKKRIDQLAEVHTGFRFRQKLQPDSAGDSFVVQAWDID